MRTCWNKIKNAQFMRRKIGNNPKNRQSRAMYYAFTYVRVFLITLGRLPMQIFSKDDGTYAYRFQRCHIHLIIFYMTSVISISLVFMITLGLFTMFFDVNKSKEKDKCGYTWESATLTRQLVPIMVTYSQLLLTAIGSIFIFLKGEDNVHYFNYWNRALEMMDMDISKNSMYYGLRGILEAVTVIVILSVFYGTGIVPSLHETSGVIASLITRLFLVDIYKGKHKSILAHDFASYKKQCNLDVTLINNFTDPPVVYTYAKLFGFLVQLYAMYSCRTFIIQFKFFCHALGNCATIWNERLKNTLHGVKTKAEDQCKTRLNVSALLKDHLIIVQLFRLTQITYYIILITYFAILAFNLIFQGHYIPLLISQESCVQTWTREMKKAEEGLCKHNVTEMRGYMNDSVTFDNPCSDERLNSLGDVLVALVWLGQNLMLLYDVSLDGTYAHEQAMQGWSIMRRHMFMWTSSKEHRNFVYSMINSLSAHNNPMWITLSGYYNLSRIFVVEILVLVLNFVINAVQFKPFVITLPREMKCYNSTGHRVKDIWEVDD